MDSIDHPQRQPDSSNDRGRVFAYIRQCLEQGYTGEQIEKTMAANGYAPQDAHRLVREALFGSPDEVLQSVATSELSVETTDPRAYQLIVANLDKAHDVDDLVRILLRNGYARPEATALVEKMIAQIAPGSLQSSQENVTGSRKAAQRNMAVGFGICLIGTLVTLYSFTTPGGIGGRYILAYGAVFWGAYQGYTGMEEWFRLRKVKDSSGDIRL